MKKYWIPFIAVLTVSLPFLAAAQPGDTPPEGNVDAHFHTARITGTAPVSTFIEALKVTGQEYQAGEGMGSFTIMNDGEFKVNVPSTSMVSRLIGTFSGRDGAGALQIFNDGHLVHSTGPVAVRDSMEIGDKYNALAIDNNGHLSDGNESVTVSDDLFVGGHVSAESIGSYYYVWGPAVEVPHASGGAGGSWYTSSVGCGGGDVITACNHWTTKMPAWGFYVNGSYIFNNRCYSAAENVYPYVPTLEPEVYAVGYCFSPAG
jgi:hypothetical protein